MFVEQLWISRSYGINPATVLKFFAEERKLTAMSQRSGWDPFLAFLEIAFYGWCNKYKNAGLNCASGGVNYLSE